MSGHTPGPWTCHIADIGASIASDGESLAAVWPTSLQGREWPLAANARLIASAPDLKADNDRLRAVNAELLEALEMIEMLYYRENKDSGWRAAHMNGIASDAIAKASRKDNA